jgi:hypothetical protein
VNWSLPTVDMLSQARLALARRPSSPKFPASYPANGICPAVAQIPAPARRYFPENPWANSATISKQFMSGFRWDFLQMMCVSVDYLGGNSSSQRYQQLRNSRECRVQEGEYSVLSAQSEYLNMLAQRGRHLLEWLSYSSLDWAEPSLYTGKHAS